LTTPIPGTTDPRSITGHSKAKEPQLFPHNTPVTLLKDYKTKTFISAEFLKFAEQL
jgi:hypothetical protein